MCHHVTKITSHSALESNNTMADNYIEKQYENHEARRAAWERAKRIGTCKPKKIKKADKKEE